MLWMKINTSKVVDSVKKQETSWKYIACIFHAAWEDDEIQKIPPHDELVR